MQLLHAIQVPPDARSQNIAVFLSSKLSKFSRNKVRGLILKNCVLIGKQPVAADHLVQRGEVIEIFDPYLEFSGNVTPENIPLNIIYEDSSVIVIDKPAGMPVHKGLGNFKGTLLNALAGYYRTSGQSCDTAGGCVHRLDSGTSGLIVFAKDLGSRKHLEAQVKEKTMYRKYIALVHGVVKENEGCIDVPVGRDPGKPIWIRAFPLNDHGKLAITHYRVLHRFAKASLVECVLQTGRTHQLRIHLQYIGHAILGDPRYPSANADLGIKHILAQTQIQHQLLHAQELHFMHPLRNEKICFQAELPAGFFGIMNQLKQGI